MATPEQWLAKLPRLNVYKAKGVPAPHKPVLLLVLLELAEQDQLPDEMLPLTPELKSPEQAREQGREARFRLTVVAAYNCPTITRSS